MLGQTNHAMFKIVNLFSAKYSALSVLTEFQIEMVS